MARIRPANLFASDDSSAGGGGTVTTTPVGGGTPNTIAMFITPLSIGDSNIHQSVAGDIGIGTAAPGPNTGLNVVFSTAGTTFVPTFTHSNSTNPASHAQLLVAVGGTGAGDPQVSWIIPGAIQWTAGLDNSDSDAWKLAASGGLDTLTVLKLPGLAGPVNNEVLIGGWDVNSSVPGDTLLVAVRNQSAAASSDAQIQIATNGVTAGDPVIRLTNLNTDWIIHLDTSVSDRLRIGTVQGSATAAIQVNTDGNVGFSKAPDGTQRVSIDGALLVSSDIRSTGATFSIIAQTAGADVVIQTGGDETLRANDTGEVILRGALHFKTPNTAAVTSFVAQNQTADANIAYTLPVAQGAASTALTNNGSGVLSWVAYQAADSDLTALAALSTTGLIVRTGSGTATTRSVAVTDSASVDFTVTNGDGVAGNPTITAAVLPAGVDHNSLANLATGDVHTQYALLAGRSTGQTLNGGTGAGENLTLSSTANATKGFILFGASSAYDGANIRLGIGIAAPTEKLHIVLATAGSVLTSLISHTDNTNIGSHAKFHALVGGASAGDPYLLFEITGATTWSVGPDNNDVDKFKICQGTTITQGGTQALVIDTNNRVDLGRASGVIAATAAVTVHESTIGTNEVFRMETVATNDDVNLRYTQQRVATTDATVTTLQTITITGSNTYLIEARVVARRTGGSAGTANDSAAYIIYAAVKDVAGTATLVTAGTALDAAVVASPGKVFENEDQAGWDATVDVNAGTARIRVTGATNNNITWHVTTLIQNLST